MPNSLSSPGSIVEIISSLLASERVCISFPGYSTLILGTLAVISISTNTGEDVEALLSFTLFHSISLAALVTLLPCSITLC